MYLLNILTNMNNREPQDHGGERWPWIIENVWSQHIILKYCILLIFVRIPFFRAIYVKFGQYQDVQTYESTKYTNWHCRKCLFERFYCIQTSGYILVKSGNFSHFLHFGCLYLGKYYFQNYTNRGV